MGNYEIYAFDPKEIGSFRPKPHQTRTREAKELAIGMLRRVEAGGADLLQQL